MKPFPNHPFINVAFDFGRGRQAIGTAAIQSRTVYFQFDTDYVERGVNPSPLSLQLHAKPQAGVRDLDGLPGLLHDSLPDGWSRLVLDRHLRGTGYDPASLTSLDRLVLVGDDGGGALTYRGDKVLLLKTPSVDFDTAAKIVAGAPYDDDVERVKAALALTGSLGGARPKAQVWLSEKGLTTHRTPGATPWIVKFPATADDREIGAVEYAYSLMARAAGVDMPPTRLLPSVDGPGFFAVERFDRTPDGGRLHMHSFGGLLNTSSRGNALGYAELMLVTGNLTVASGTDVASIEQQIRRMAFNVIARNRDDHSKNHAFLMDEAGGWKCAPAFDLTYSNLPEHALLVGNVGRNPTRKDMLEVARSVKIPDETANALVDEVQEAVANWTVHAKEAGIRRSLIKDVGESIGARPDNEMSGAAINFLRSRGGGLGN